MSGRTCLPIILIAAVARNGVIGHAQGMPWTLPGDMAYFRAATWGKPVVMGRRTFETIGQPLPGRPTIVLSRNSNFPSTGLAVAHTVQDAMASANSIGCEIGADSVMIAGGATLYSALLPQARSLLITDVESYPEGDVHFPTIDPSIWMETERTVAAPSPGDSASYAFVRLDRR